MTRNRKKKFLSLTNRVNDDFHSDSSFFSSPPFIAIITETDACDSEKRMKDTLRAIRSAVSTQCVDLISVRVSPPYLQNNEICSSEEKSEFQDRVVQLTRRIIALRTEKLMSKSNFAIVINDNVQAALDSGADGVHVKEMNVDQIPAIREQILRHRLDLKDNNVGNMLNRRIVIGTSAHTVHSAHVAWKKYSPDYFFVGTCYLTGSHPEKRTEDLEGPQLPGLVRATILRDLTQKDKALVTPGQIDYHSSSKPAIFAIGGINLENCSEPVTQYGADGVAMIRTVLQAENPYEITRQIQKCLTQS
eukprot:CAMPEP_0184867778 /NCGR_PEP_ID=MMETSP0580-20130426/27673_1 /TAXON_ID=1118495 /ORGANISM="Dactyliosolen fragilissimus" /LENGTH=303 /DNA_ID=CAMNT_0027368231 /DNA_START=262 /DNA_END=1173 /DNA_ORIENTATION=-